MTRGEFIRTAGAAAVMTAAGRAFGGEAAIGAPVDYAALQAEIDEVTPQMFFDYNANGQGLFADWFGIGEQPALTRLDAAFDKVMAEVKSTVVTDKPAIWFVYNMGVIVKTKETCFSIDLKHRKAPEIAPLLDFALITHNHGDHFTEEFYKAMNGAGKTVISNFKDNYGTKDWVKNGGYTRVPKTFKLGDVEIHTSLTDHNGYLVDYTTVFEIQVGKYVILHSGDCGNVNKLNPRRCPDLWMMHPYCCMKIEDGVKRMRPKLTAVMHLNELGHARWRWTWQDGLKAKEAAEKAGGEAIVPMWGDRIF